ncbi:MAG: thiol-disulfide oxidoreductase DCC family protein [Verrucomicrobiales bacterium]
MNRTRHIVLYDSDCPLCTFQMRLLTWLDWLDKVRLMPINDPESAGIAPELTREELREAIHCITPEGKVYRGARCFRFLGFRLPALVPLALFLWIPGVIWVAEKVYMWVSRNRQLLSKWFGCKGACAILPERKREGEAERVSDR